MCVGRTRSVKQQNPIKDQVGEEADRGERKYHGRAVEFRAEADGLGQQVEERHPDDGSGAETQYQMQFVMQPERQKSTEQCAYECGRGDD